MTDANKNLVLRIVSALVLLPVVLFLLWYSPLTTGILGALGAAGLAYEYYTIVFKKLDPALVGGILASAALPLCFALWPDRYAAGVVVGTGALTILAFSYYLLRGPLPEAPLRVAFLVTGVAYCGLLLSTLSGLRPMQDGLGWIILALAVTWGNDTAAYAAGRALGKHKLYPAVSPGKTWEGFFGGALGSVGCAFVVKALMLPTLSPLGVLAVALPCSVLGPIGDLCESMLKRAYQVKDSGKIIPGHGGLLDRVDALLFNLPYVWLYASVLAS
ncbi:MAG: phosphatidate cytidylyltransferase [Myxococcales bacterium]